SRLIARGGPHARNPSHQLRALGDDGVTGAIDDGLRDPRGIARALRRILANRLVELRHQLRSRVDLVSSHDDRPRPGPRVTPPGSPLERTRRTPTRAPTKGLGSISSTS